MQRTVVGMTLLAALIAAGCAPKVYDPFRIPADEFRRRVKTQAVLPSEDSALLLLYGLAASGQLRFRKLDGYQELDQVGRVAA